MQETRARTVTVLSRTASVISLACARTGSAAASGAAARAPAAALMRAACTAARPPSGGSRRAQQPNAARNTRRRAAARSVLPQKSKKSPPAQLATARRSAPSSWSCSCCTPALRLPPPEPARHAVSAQRAAQQASTGVPRWQAPRASAAPSTSSTCAARCWCTAPTAMTSGAHALPPWALSTLAQGACAPRCVASSAADAGFRTPRGAARQPAPRGTAGAREGCIGVALFARV